MIVTEMYYGQGLGNQLWNYLFLRCLALRKNYSFGIKNPERFKGHELFNLDFGKQVFGGNGPEGGPPVELPIGIEHYFQEPRWYDRVTKLEITEYTDVDNLITDDCKIDGNWQCFKYIEDFQEDIRIWLEPKTDLPDDLIDKNTCIINFRGGEYRHMNRVLLQTEYWVKAIREIRKSDSHINFKCISDDIKLAKKIINDKSVEFLDQPMELDYLCLLKAHYVVLSNSSFAMLPVWLNTIKREVIAPKYWWGHYHGFWSPNYMQLVNWTWM